MAIHELEESEQAGESGPDKPKGRFASLATLAHKFAGGAKIALPKLGLYLFMVILPLLVIAYPAYLLSSRLVAYGAASTVDATLVDLEVNRVQNAEGSHASGKGHTEVLLKFRDEAGKRHVATLQLPWSVPGLRRELEDQYEKGDGYTLYLLPDGTVATDDMVGKDNFLRLTGLVALAFVAYLLYFMIRLRLASRMPDLLHLPSMATAKSLIFGQLIVLVLAVVFTAIISVRPVFVPAPAFLGAYFGLVACLALSLRLLLFQDN